ncbi:MAG: aspartate kinase [Spirochaetia bacterium]|jgi:aspartate kinase|nr:aspartate kinase [Spirochaetia bacterium]
MELVVMKFDGASLSDAAGLRLLADRVRGSAAVPLKSGSKATAKSGTKLSGCLVVVSALSGVTDSLFFAAGAAEKADLGTAQRVCAELRERHLSIARQLGGENADAAEEDILSLVSALESRLQGVRLVGELTDRNMDEIAAAGERLASILAALALEAPSLDARRALRTDSRFGRARVDMNSTQRLCRELFLPHLKTNPFVVTQGSIGSDSLGSTTSIGRGASDLSASIFGAALGAAEIRIWTDHEGLPTADPKIVPGAMTIQQLGFEEASELVAFGAKILHPAAIKPALEAGIPVTVRSVTKPLGRFSTILPGGSSGKAVAALAMRPNVAIVSVKQELMMDQAGFLARLFAAFGRLGVSVDLVSTSEVCVSVSLDMGAPLDRLASELGELGTVEIVRDRAVIAVVGDMLKETPTLLRKTFNALGDMDVDMLSMGANDINLSIVMAAQRAENALRRLHKAFFETAEAADNGGATP